MTDQTNTALVVMPATKSDVAALFSNAAAIDAMVADIQAKAVSEAEVIEHDFSVKRNASAIRSVAHRVSRSKTAIIAAGKELTEDARRQVEAVRLETKRVEAALDALKSEILAPVTKWEADEAERVARLESRLSDITRGASFRGVSAEYSTEASRIASIAVGDDWQEFRERAEAEKARVLEILSEREAVAKKAEADAAELAELRAAQAEQARIEERRRAEDEEKRRKLIAAAEEAERRAVEAEAAIKAEIARREAAELAQIAAEKKAADEAKRIALERSEREAEEKRAAQHRLEMEAKRKELRDEAIDQARAAISEINPSQMIEAIIAGNVPHVRFDIGANE